MYYRRLYNTTNTTYSRPAKDTKFFPQQAGKNCRCRMRVTYNCSFLLHEAGSFVPTFLILVRTCWQEELLDGAPTGCKALVNTMENLSGKHFFSGCIALLKNFIELHRENSTCSAYSQIPQVL